MIAGDGRTGMLYFYINLVLKNLIECVGGMPSHQVCRSNGIPLLSAALSSSVGANQSPIGAQEAALQVGETWPVRW